MKQFCAISYVVSYANEGIFLQHAAGKRICLTKPLRQRDNTLAMHIVNA